MHVLTERQVNQVSGGINLYTFEQWEALHNDIVHEARVGGAICAIGAAAFTGFALTPLPLSTPFIVGVAIGFAGMAYWAGYEYNYDNYS